MKSRLPHYSKLPWTAPVPVKASQFVPMRPDLAPYNVVPDPGAIPIFDLKFEKRPKDELLYAELHTCVYHYYYRRIGTGRSGYYRDRYLKGIGRTPLAIHWNDRDLHHGSGHLHASNAIREFLSSEFLRAKGASDTIVPCEGLLFRKIDRDSRDYLRTQYPRTKRFLAVDENFHAISVKPAGFVRASSFIWLLNHVCNPTQLKTFFLLLFQATGPVGTPAVTRLPTPDDLAERLDQAIERGLCLFEKTFGLGVSWASVWNNYALDGRFIDLETPLIVGAPFFGSAGDVLAGFDSVFFLIEMRRFVEFLRQRLRHIVSDRHYWKFPLSLYALEVADALDRRFSKSHLAFSDSKIRARFEALLCRNMDLSSSQRKELREFLSQTFDLTLKRHGLLGNRGMKRISKIELSRREPHFGVELYAPRFLPALSPSDPRVQEAQELNRLQTELFTHKTMDRLIQQLNRIRWTA